MGFPRREYWGGLPFPPPGALLTQGSNPHLWRLLHWQVDSKPAGHLGSPGEPQALAAKLLLREMSTRWQHSPCPSRVSLATGTLEKGTFLGCRSEWTVPGLCLMTSSPPPEPPRQIPDPAKAEAEGAVLVRWRDSEGEAAAGKPTTGRLVGDQVTFQSSFSAEGPLFWVALGLVELCEGLPGSGGQGPSRAKRGSFAATSSPVPSAPPESSLGIQGCQTLGR